MGKESGLPRHIRTDSTCLALHLPQSHQVEAVPLLLVPDSGAAARSHDRRKATIYRTDLPCIFDAPRATHRLVEEMTLACPLPQMGQMQLCFGRAVSLRHAHSALTLTVSLASKFGRTSSSIVDFFSGSCVWIWWAVSPRIWQIRSNRTSYWLRPAIRDTVLCRSTDLLRPS